MTSAGFLLFLALATTSVASCAENILHETPEAAGPLPVNVEARQYAGAPEGVLRVLDDRLTVEAVFSLESSHPSFGGLSGLWLDEDGGRMIAISDIGQRWEARLGHDDRGRLVSLEDWSVADLARRSEERTGSRWLDSEALSGDGQDSLVVAFEGNHRLRRWSLDDLDQMPERLALPEGLGDASNSGIEALSTLPDGRLFALAERVGAWGGKGLMGWVIDGKTSNDLAYMPAPGFAPTGAARLGDKIYVVERSFSLLGGFRSRIVTLSARDVRPGAHLKGVELAAFQWGNLGENFEAIVARRGPDGRILLYLLADDNFSFLQKTLLVQLSLPAEDQAN